ncbi:fimbrial protein [Moellerella wisconsensis]|uniref:Fimbrial protein n=2 Tax=Moellerella wisconsensis TaxID=158849 RepID=A0ACD3Y3K7_9GAMM|nr:fimbrial protein [Moellerella wisconsensis]KLN97482.1 hypothetical protein VK86_04485 [Moellerella wisconsensis]UNH23004.1 fimbrial protein [Moellerella wisconsensis]UNH26142.1 fimbrial protein [Moellerella wisconsensis]UNH29557.1 fimbrial protein [Moellerella wisconsensis]UNH37697.1 fimbrial protein [Moellerella wisconsensis]
MKNKNKLLTTLSIIGLSITINAYADDGKINFIGNIIDNTCTIEQDSLDQNVILGDVSKEALNGAAEKTAAPTQFIINMTNCPDVKAKIKFDGLKDSINPNLLALNTEENVATGVGIRITDMANKEISLYTATDLPDLTSTPVKLNFIARYVSTGDTVTIGKANSTSQFTIIYN